MFKEITINDIKEISELFAKVFNNPPWNDKWNYETSSKRLIDIINSPGYIGMSYYDNDELVGIIMGRKEQYYDGMHFQILEFCIDNEKQGNGYGKKILSYFIDKLRDEGIINVFLQTLHDKSTEGFYSKNNFVSCENMVVMSQRL